MNNAIKTDIELLELYAEAYQKRDASILEEYLAPVVFYFPRTDVPQLIEKNSFIALLNGKFDKQNVSIPVANMEIKIVLNETTGADNIHIDFGKGIEKILISIDTNDNLISQINILENKPYKLIDKKILLRKDRCKKYIISNNKFAYFQKSKRLSYLDSGEIFILPENDPHEVINIILNTNYPYESCLSDNFDIDFIRKLLREGFLIMSRFIPAINKFILEASHHLSRSVLFFDHVHITKTVKRIMGRYELRFDDNFNVVIAKCVEKHGNDWLTVPLIKAIKAIKEQNTNDENFVSFSLYRNGNLVAGDFGYKKGRVYTSYSGFYDENNAGSVQIALTAQYLKNSGYAFWDFGMPMPAYKSILGARVVNMESFIELWRKYSIQTPKPGLEMPHYPELKQGLSDFELMTIFKNTYRYFYISDLKDYLVDDFHYASQHVFDEIKSKQEYLKYLSGKLNTIKHSTPPSNILKMEIVYDTYSNAPYLLMKQGKDEALFIPKTKDGRFERIDLCMPQLYNYRRVKPCAITNKFDKDGCLTGTNYWESELCGMGHYYLVCHKDSFSLLIPHNAKNSLLKELFEQFCFSVIITKGNYNGKPNCFELMFEDNSDEPYTILLEQEQVDCSISKPVYGWNSHFCIYSDGLEEETVYIKNVYFRTADTLPCMLPPEEPLEINTKLTLGSGSGTLEHFEAHGDHLGAFGASDDELLEILQECIKSGTFDKSNCYTFKETDKSIVPRIYPKTAGVQVCALEFTERGEKTLTVESFFPLLEGLKNDVVLADRHPWKNKIEGEIEINIPGRENYSFFAPFYYNNFSNYAAGDKIEVYLAGLAYSAEQPVTELEINEGHFYTTQLKKFLRENTGKTKKDFPPLMIQMDNLIMFTPSKYYSEFEYFGKIIELEYINFMNKKFAKIKICILRIDDEDKMFINLYISPNLLQNYTPKIGGNIHGILWLTGYTKTTEAI
ncbi:MAG: GNAT family N-acetyltransferase [Spirochaetaceae bacterium]|jgi:Leu/Phe-tRNA-protein transferase|nr:GNAT family N-acetyltransferase [Spirochaetaceae bacterium]